MKNQNRTCPLPKNREKLEHAIKPFCFVNWKVLSAEYLTEKLVDEEFIRISESGLQITKKQFSHFPPEDSGVHFTHALHESQLAAAEKTFKWASGRQESPSSVAILHKSLEQFCFQKLYVQSGFIIERLIEQKQISVDPLTGKITYLP